ncbi:MAG: hypothetical protein M3530_00330 [Thermoproteota archaeon]|nr:hypothetical protein [Thermoproteota archaeon]
MIKPLDYDVYWKRWLNVCVEGILKESTEREKRSNQQHHPLDQEYQESGANN